MASDEQRYKATLRFLIASYRRSDQKGLVGGRNVGGSLAYSFDGGGPVSEKDVADLRNWLGRAIQDGATIETTQVPYAEALELCVTFGLSRSVALLKSRVTDAVEIHRLHGAPTTNGSAPVGIALMGERLLPRASDVEMPNLTVVDGSLIVDLGAATAGEAPPKTKRPKGTHPSVEHSKSVLEATSELAAWGGWLGVDGMGALNQLASSGRELNDFILQAEFRQESILTRLAAAIAARVHGGGSERIGVVCIAGPTSSGKTTFANKLTMYLRNVGLAGIPLTVDHYYLPLDRQPKYQARQQRSDVDYDAIESMDAALVNEHINALLEGKEVLTPVYNMKSGYRDGDGVPFKLPSPVSKSLLVIEGIHALNPDFLRSVAPGKVFRVYISPLSALQLTEGVALKTTDARLLRRMCRDYNFRGASASRTLSMWSNVRRGEGRWIFPFQDAVDFVVNSSHEYEVRVLKPLVEPLLMAVPPTDAHYDKARSLLQMLALISAAPTTHVPTTSLLREFIGGGDFDCH